MGEFDFSIDIDASGAFRILENLDNKIEDSKEKLTKATAEVEQETKRSAMSVRGMMRASYMMVSGFAQMMGGDMGRVFTSLYGVAISSIQLYSALTPAVGVVNPIGAALMYASLMSSIFQLSSLARGQSDLAQQMHGLTMGLHGLNGLIGVIGY